MLGQPGSLKIAQPPHVGHGSSVGDGLDLDGRAGGPLDLHLDAHHGMPAGAASQGSQLQHRLLTQGGMSKVGIL